MFRSNKTSLASANDIINSLTESSEIMSGTGAVVITQKNGRKTTNTGTIYLRDGLIYAAAIENRRIPIGVRIETGALVRSDDLDEVLSKVSGDTTSPRIIDHLLENHMISEKTLSSYIKEHFIETLGKIMSWNDSLGEWHPNTVTNDFLMPFVTFERIREILDHRKHVYGEFLRLVEKFMLPEELPALTFSLIKAPTAAQSPTTRKITSLCDSKNTIDNITEATGVTFYNVFQTIVGLWRDGLLTLNIGGIKLPYTAVLAQPEPEHVPAPVELTNPPIPVHDETVEKSDASMDEDASNNEESDPVEGERGNDATSDNMEIHNEIPEYAAEEEEEEEDEEEVFHPLRHDDSPVVVAEPYDPIENDEFIGYEETSTDSQDNLDVTDSADGIAQSQSFTTAEADHSENMYDESPKPVDESDKGYVLPRDILNRRTQVNEITRKLNKLESKLADCEESLHDNQVTIDALDDKKMRLEQELAELKVDYKNTIADRDNIKGSYESIRKEVEDTINSFTFIEGE